MNSKLAFWAQTSNIPTNFMNLTENHCFNIVASVVAGWLLLLVFYKLALRPVMLDCYRYQIFEIRDRLRRLAIDGKVNAKKDFAYNYLEKRLCHLASIVPEITPARLTHFAIHRASKVEEPYEAKRFDEQASPELKKLWAEALRQIAVGIIINSPVITLPLVAIFVVVFHYMEGLRYLKQTKLFKTVKEMTRSFVEQEMIQFEGKPAF